ncbi:hypothetical protein ACP70R_018676 [Stipagrostis hirtigluma subsp. patula]
MATADGKIVPGKSTTFGVLNFCPGAVVEDGHGHLSAVDAVHAERAPGLGLEHNPTAHPAPA